MKSERLHLRDTRCEYPLTFDAPSFKMALHPDVDAYEQRDLETWAQCDIPAMGEAGQLADANAVRAMWVGIIAAFPDIHFEPGPLYHGDTHIFVEVRMTGTQQGDFVGIPATGRSFDTRVASLYEFEEDQLVCERVYYDLADILRQLGVLTM